MVCTFFGHRDTPDSVRPLLWETVERLIVDCGVDQFYVGREGNFDRMAAQILHRMQRTYAISFAVVLSRLPTVRDACNDADGEAYPTIFPEAVELGPPRFALDRRNRWMVDRADYVVTYVRWGSGGAAKFKALAARRGKTVLNLAECGA